MEINRTEIQKQIIDMLWGYVEEARISGFKAMESDAQKIEYGGGIQEVMQIEFSWFLPNEGEEINNTLDLVLKEYCDKHNCKEVWKESALELEYQNGIWHIYFNS